ncbi:UNVERIFIED_CONTAM: hypothetical protein Sangu_0154200 [Sesamum angustifolium]|uniref:Uncharacterized protein n=1 Tax=Sesamum angustifolium TaxID=2727405 RepID=A0AAW2RLD0_9LAMI
MKSDRTLFCFLFMFEFRIINKMLRRNIRLRREYLYRKSLEGKERLLYEKKRKIREAVEGRYCSCCNLQTQEDKGDVT